MQRTNSCKRCGACCCNVLIFEHEANQIKSYLKQHPELISRLLRPFNHDGCIFLLPDTNETWKCAIYDSAVRPTICKIFGTKGINKLKCPENHFVGTKYTRKQALQMVEKNEQKSQIIGTMNDIMIPFVAQCAKENIMKNLLSK